MEITNGIYSAEDVASKLLKPVRAGQGWNACCPAHDNTDTPALSINDGENGKILVKCFAGCTQTNVIEALRSMGAWPEYKQKKSPDKFKIIKEYTYTNEHGELAYVVCRTNSKPKFIQKRPHSDGSWIWGLSAGEYAKNIMGDWSKPKKNTRDSVYITGIENYYPYRLPKLIQHPNIGICLCEGEKDADNLAALKLLTTTISCGAGSWRKEYEQYFKDRKVYIIQDNDKAGEEGAVKKANALMGIASVIKIIQLPQNGDIKVKDVSNWIENGGTYEQFISIVKSTPEYQHRNKQVVVADPVLGTVPNAAIDSSVGYIEWIHTTNKGAPLSTIENTRILLDSYNISVRYNATKKSIDVNIPGRSWLIDNADNCALAEITSLAVRHGLAEGRVKNYLISLADENAYNPFAEWIDSKEWDGVPRIQYLFESLDAQQDKTFGLMMLTKWLISGIEANFNPEGVSRSPVLVLQGAQYAGKTTWFWSLVGGSKVFGKEACILNPADKDSVMQAVSYAVVELGELEATFRKADIAALKGFISKDFDQLRKPYAETDSKYPRRTIFMATVNSKEVLHDETGSTRFWMIECGTGLNGRHNLDMQQIWAEAKALWQGGMSHIMTRDEVQLLNKHNQSYSTITVIEELIHEYFNVDADKSLWSEKTATEVLVICNVRNPSAKDRSNCGAALSKLFGEPVFKYGRRVYLVPPKANPIENRLDHSRFDNSDWDE